jgi:hypothetical protein
LNLPVISNLPPNFKECGECQKCCEGWVAGTAFGIPFHPYKPCAFLQGKCLVYSFRPDVCKKFYCAWSQGLFPDWMRPDKTNVLISVQDWSKGQFLKVIACGSKIEDKVINEVKRFSTEQMCPYIIHDENGTNLIGPEEFIKELSQ